MGYLKLFLGTVLVLVILIVLIVLHLGNTDNVMFNSFPRDITNYPTQSMMEEKEWITKGLQEAAESLKGAKATEKLEKEEIFMWYKDALQSYGNFEGAYRAYIRMNAQQELWAGKAFNPDTVLKKWPGILLNGDPGESKMLYMTDQQGNPSQVQPDDISKMPNKEAEDRFHKLIRDIHIHCLNRRRIGNMHDGGWDICTSGPFMPQQNDCLVYSFGINHDFSFDDAMAQNYGCDVYSFDPSMGVASHNRSKHVHFYNLGIAEKDEYDAERKWTLKTLDTLFKENGHSDKIITILKMDIEGMETNILRKIVQTDILKNVMQFYFEIHLWSYSKAMLYYLYTLLYEVEVQGFRRFHYHQNWHCIARSNITGIQRSLCHELFYVNTNFFP